MGRRGRPPHPDILTPREWEVLALLRDGLTNEEIAGRLGISVDGVKFHVSEILSKLGVANRQEAAAWSPERRPWWLAAGAPVAFVWRRTAVLALRLSPLSSALAVGLVVVALGGLGTLAFFVVRARSDSNARQASTGLVATQQNGTLPPVVAQQFGIPTPAPTPATDGNWSAFWLADARTAWLAGSACPSTNPALTTCQGIIEKTTDAGESWEIQYTGDVVAAQFQFVDLLNGWAVGPQAGAICDQDHACPNVLLSTTDGGAHWTPVYTAPRQVTQIAFTGNGGWLLQAQVPRCECAPHLLNSIDGGQTWTDITLPLSGLGFSLSRPTASDGWVVSSSGGSRDPQIIVTHDDGQIWSSLPLPPGAGGDEASIFFRSSEQGWLLLGGQPSAGSQPKELFGTSDGGETWTHISGGFGAMPAPAAEQGGLSSIGYIGPLFFTSPEDGWTYLGHLGLFHSTDGGRTWYMAIEAGLLRDVRFAGTRQGWFWTYYPTQLRVTSDGGVTWTPLPLPTVGP